ncbi:hypothetical protein [Chelativorans intermedius]|uniref:HTH marR-type domain-containing protein n=1 Tax=Chelativorans intermedius TaxID=515947 RepID=A0ABV6D7W3_9HYPH|nr:hypothetical protein [Chelativorans intermedius]MCT8999942.1 hypothetical protein [Chelativorans intermedius]
MSNESIFRSAILGGAFTYTARPDPVPGDLRMSWGMATLVLTLFYSRGKKSNFQKLQFLAHAVRLPEGREEVRGFLAGEYRPTEVSVRVEPSLNRAVALAHGLKLVKIDKGTSISLTEQGEKMAQAILEQGDSLKEETEFLREVAPRMTDALMKRVWRLEDLI